MVRDTDVIYSVNLLYKALWMYDQPE
jgi:hypothetical protein